MANHHDTGYKELFSYPEFVQQLIEGFAPPELAALMDFATLKDHNGNYITPLFEERFEDAVWSVEVTWEGTTQRVYLYILLEFQSRVDYRMPLRMMHYTVCFYEHLIKTKVITPNEGLPPVLPIVLYNGSQRWSAPQDVYGMIAPEPPSFLGVYQPRLRYYLIDEGRYTEEELVAQGSVLSGVFSIENAKLSKETLQRAVDRIVAIIQADPNKERIDKVITRWLKRHLRRLGANIDLERLNSLVEDRDMFAENLDNWREQTLKEGLEKGRQEGLVGALRVQLGLKFGELPTWADDKLNAATDEQLNLWIARILTVDSLEALFAD
ncbi:Rpn family recombination-promoting nuclease/putative transposase [Pistricoccus aurantiacus]|uniref:Rpn family recombination-promoting nuclease/putative transposase n=1 Tax=Pistricoccus aurantiacus TaxID=1883414 RepID=UPI00362EB057